MDKKPEAVDLARIDAEEFARLEAEKQAKSEAKEVEREALDRAWREQAEYSRAVAELKDDPGRRASGRAFTIAAALLIAAGIVGAVVYSYRAERERRAEAEALRLAAESLARRDAEERAGKSRAQALAPEPGKPPGVAADSSAKAPSGEDAKKAAADKARTLALKIREEARRQAELAAQAKAMAQAEERAKAVAAKGAQEAPRAAQRPGTVFQDCADCPHMVVIPAGEFTMGSPASEIGRGLDEGPQRQVQIARPFALGRSEVTVEEFRRFVEEAGYKTEAERDTRAQGCAGFIYADPAAPGPGSPPYTSWRSPGLAQAQADPHPVLCVSWNDARAYAQWLSKKTGKRYRLPTEAEWEYAARAGSSSSRYWGDDPVQACRYANVADQSRFQTWSFGQKHECTDGHYFTAPAGGYAPNRFGLYDVIGNVWEWTEDCWNASYAGAPSDGGAWLSGDCSQRVLRGGSWSTVPRYARSATRYKNPADFRDNLTGFRLARNLD
ncbi:MAG TPA: formylglycine-generating enzyme family protein [Burkholderiales bacterium]|jgi:formylglycine-generating enzyme required for sulfatase activity|nr:formylglycine-generating enzyme family protein [Burkholderiales bacterium]